MIEFSMPIAAPIAAPVTTSNREEDSMNNEPSQSGKMITGIIFPPPEIRNIVDKTAGFVARNGFEFENRIRQNEMGNDKFLFLVSSNPYHSYYQSRVKEFRDGVVTESSISKPTGLPSKVAAHVKAAEFVPTEPPHEFEFMADPATINAYELDLIKMTALFCARNGRSFMAQLANREARNYQFDFLKPQHSNFNYFTKLIEQYTKVFMPTKQSIAELKADLANPKAIIEDVKYRVGWAKQQKRIREREEAEAEQERLAYAQIDWHDFVVVQTVDYQPSEVANLPPPCTPRDVGARMLAQHRIEVTGSTNRTEHRTGDMVMALDEEDRIEAEALAQMGEGGAASQDNIDDVEMDMDEDEQVEEVKRSTQPTTKTLGAGLDTVTIRDYNPHMKQVEAVKASEKKWVISPLTGERVQADKLSEHMRYNTVDTQYFQQREKEMAEKADEVNVFASGVDVSSHIKEFASRRSDIFGVGHKGAEQTAIGEEMMESVGSRVWQEQQEAMGAGKVTIEQQLQDIQKATGMDMGVGKPKEAAAPPPVVQPMRHPAQAPMMTARPVAPAHLQQRLAEQAVPRSATGANKQALPAGAARPPSPPSVPPTPEGSASVPPPPPSQPPPQQTPPQPPAPMSAVAHQMPLMQQPGSAPFGGVIGQTPGMSYPPMPHAPLYQQPPPPMDEPASKRAKPDSDYIDEDIWLLTHQGDIAILVQMPVDERADWNCKGQSFPVTIDNKSTITQLKSIIEQSTKMPPTKQKIALGTVFVKDTNSLAYYNLVDGAVLTVSVKERGGKKK